MIDQWKYSPFIKWTLLIFCVGWMVVMNHRQQFPIDFGDGLMHYFIAQASWENPTLLLNHWGKPLFTLLSSPFAQFGHTGMIAFNVLVFLFTVWIGWLTLDRLKIPLLFQCLFPLLLLTIPEYTGTVLAGLTEPLFNLFVVLALYLGTKRNWMWFAIIVSFLPFLRSEGQLPVVLAFIILLFEKQWKYLPFLAGGFVIYSIIGAFVLDDFWWYFTQSPYHLDNAIYGSGTWDHYLKSHKNFLGNPGLFLFIAAFIRLAYLFIAKKWKEIPFAQLFFTYGIFMGVVALHSYFWAMGINGSLGLTRLATQGLPSFLLMNLYLIGSIQLKAKAQIYGQLALGLTMLLLITNRVRSSEYPTPTDQLTVQVSRAADFVQANLKKGTSVFFHHPVFAYRLDCNSFRKNQSCVLYYGNQLDKDLGTLIKPGDYLVRDSYFGPQEAQLPLSKIALHPELTPIKSFNSALQLDDPNGEIEGVIVYQYQPGRTN